MKQIASKALHQQSNQHPSLLPSVAPAGLPRSGGPRQHARVCQQGAVRAEHCKAFATTISSDALLLHVQGFPDQEGPESMKEIASKALYEQSNQYPSLLGVPQLRQAVARHSEANQGLACDWATETLITVGATEGIASAFMGLINQGDEVGERQPNVHSVVRWQ
jgi:aspartate/methionine/tyrosine aminotransferase